MSLGLYRIAVAVFLALAVVTAAPGALSPAAAQQAASEEQAAPDYAAWEKVASRAEDVLGDRRASNTALEELRSELVNWRARFLSAQDTNAARIKTLREQIAALGPAPPEGETEPREIATRRAELNKQLADLQAPGLKAVEAHSRADGLIREIDGIIRERQANKLLELGPSPLNPVNWKSGAEALKTTGEAILSELAAAWGSPERLDSLRERLPVTLLYFGLAAVLLARGRRWIERFSDWLLRRTERRGGSVYAALASLGQIVVPSLGIFLLVAGFASTGLAGPRGIPILAALPVLGLTFFAARWLGTRVFAERGVSRVLFDLSPERMAEARWHATGMGLVIVLAGLVGAIGQFEEFPEEAKAVVNFPLIVAGGLLLIRMGQILLAHSRAERAPGQERPYRNRIIGLLGRAGIVLGIVGPVLAAVGYREAAGFFTFQPIMTLALLGLLLIMQRLVSDLYALIAGHAHDTESGGGDALLPVLIGLALAVLALPVLALIWGARVSDLTEVWQRFTAGFAIGDTRISPADFLTFVVVFALGYTLTRLVQGTLRSTVLPKTRIDPGGQTALISGVGYIGIFLAALIAITTAGIDLSSLAIVAGALSVGIGFGLRTVVENFVSGIILLIERPISQGDWIEVGGVMGTVQDISVRSTRIQTFDRTDVIVPNADLIAGAVTNWTRQNLTGRVILKVGVAYGSDTRHVEKVLREIGESHPLVMVNPPPAVVFQGFGADCLDFELRVILRDINYGMSVRTELNHQIAQRFAEEGIEIPFAQREVRITNLDEVVARVAEVIMAPGGFAARPRPGPRHEVSPEGRQPPRTPGPDFDRADDGDSDGDDAR